MGILTYLKDTFPKLITGAFHLAIGLTIVVRYRDDIPGWPGLVIPALATSFAAFFPTENAFRILLAITTALFVFESSVQAFVYSSAAVMVKNIARLKVTNESNSFRR